MNLVALIEAMREAGRPDADILKAVIAAEKRRLEAERVRKALYPKAKDWVALSKQVWARDGARCSYCGETNERFAVDHVIPVSAGGSNELSNLALACVPCNSSKRDRPLGHWRGRAR